MVPDICDYCLAVPVCNVKRESPECREFNESMTAKKLLNLTYKTPKEDQNDKPRNQIDKTGNGVSGN